MLKSKSQDDKNVKTEEDVEYIVDEAWNQKQCSGFSLFKLKGDWGEKPLCEVSERDSDEWKGVYHEEEMQLQRNPSLISPRF